MQVIIDRFEADFAVVEIDTGNFVNMPRCLLPHDAKEGDVIQITIDSGETKKRRKKIDQLMDNLFED